MKPPTRPAEHVLDIYGTHLHLAWTPRQWGVLKRKAKTLGPTPQCAGQVVVATRTPKDRGLTEYHVFIWIDRACHDNTRDLVDTIAHEAGHATSRILDRIGHDYRDGSEAHSYLLGWLTGWIWEQIEGNADLNRSN